MSVSSAPFLTRREERMFAALTAAVPILLPDLLHIAASYLGRRFVEWDERVSIDNAAGRVYRWSMAGPVLPVPAKSEGSKRQLFVTPQPAGEQAALVSADRGVALTVDFDGPFLHAFARETLAESQVTRWAIRFAEAADGIYHMMGVMASAPVHPMHGMDLTDLLTNTQSILHCSTAAIVSYKLATAQSSDAADRKACGWVRMSDLTADEVKRLLSPYLCLRSPAGIVYEFDADLEANVLRVQLHRPFNARYADAKALPTPSPVIEMRFPKDHPLGTMRQHIALWGPRVTAVDTSPGEHFPRMTHDDTHCADGEEHSGRVITDTRTHSIHAFVSTSAHPLTPHFAMSEPLSSS